MAERASNNEGRLSALETNMTRVLHDFYGNGQPGLIDKITEFMTIEEESKRSLEKALVIKERKDASRNRLLITLISLVALLVSGFGLYLTFFHKSTAQINPPQVRHSELKSPVDASDRPTAP